MARLTVAGDTDCPVSSVTMRAMMSFVRTPLSDGSASRSAGTSLPMAA